MQKLFNDPKDIIEQSIDGFVKCYNKIVQRTECDRTIKYKPAPISGKVGIISGGGFGHDPAFMGYIGKNMLDAVAIGDTFKPPSTESFYEAIKAADSGNGVVCLIGNYKEDIESLNIAIEMAEEQGISVKTVVANDEVETGYGIRRGMTGEVLLWKLGGAAATLGYDADKIVRVCERSLEKMRTIGVGLSSSIIPEEGFPNYMIEKGTMEIGVGHHGIFSKDTCKLKSADETADIMINEILKSHKLKPGSRVLVMLSGLGNTIMCELNVMYRRVYDVLTDEGYEIHHAFVGNYFTSLDMMGVTLTIFDLDNELIKLIDLPAYPVSNESFVYSF